MSLIRAVHTFKIGLEDCQSILIDVEAMNKGRAHHDSTERENTATTTKIGNRAVFKISKGGFHGVQHAGCDVRPRGVLLCRRVNSIACSV